jgi:hypothetical protein
MYSLSMGPSSTRSVQCTEGWTLEIPYLARIVSGLQRMPVEIHFPMPAAGASEFHVPDALSNVDVPRSDNGSYLVNSRVSA